MVNLLWFAAVFTVCLILQHVLLKKEYSSTPAGAIVMANGIFLYSAMQQFPILYACGKAFAFILAAVWALIVISIISTLADRSFRKRHLHDPVHLFAIGTWVAGTSVLGNVIHQFSLDLGVVPYLMGILNIALYVWYISHCVKVFPVILRTSAKNRVHGVILLATVSTQSIVLLLYNIFDRLLPDWGNTLLISFGILLYVIGFYLIVRRYIVVRNWHIIGDWKNTNCILHGAISITGLAAATTGALGYNFTLVLWLWVVGWFVIVEMIEIWRAAVRIKFYGFIKGVGSYDVSQWSRNFTFGMLYAFTNRFQIDGSELLLVIRGLILDYGHWIVFLFLINEILLFFKAKTKVKWKEKPELEANVQ